MRLRASQINGCGFCTDMHTKDAAHAGETALRLNLVAAWRGATVFSDAERAALELTEQGTRIADAAGGVADEAWTNAAKHYDEDQLAPTTIEWFPRGEAVHYREHAIDQGVPAAAIHVEPEATNTGQNITFTRRLLEEKGIRVASVLLTCPLPNGCPVYGWLVEEGIQS